MASNGLVIISPVRNEEEFIQSTIDSVTHQATGPDEWIIVDDGSSDSTWKILENAARKHDRIKILRRADRGFRQSGAGVVEAFYEGLSAVSSRNWRFIAKLDADLAFDAQYFGRCLNQFEAEPSLGIGGGTICARIGDRLQPESSTDPKFHVRGAVKIYRRECWEAIGGIVRGPCWDSIDELHANMLGWTTRTFPDLQVHHQRPAGQAFGRWKDWVKGGRGNYVTGYHPVFMLLKCLSRLRSRPFGLATCGLMCGFISGYVSRAPRLVSKDLMSFIRVQQVRKLTGRPSLWTE